jgi:hypothetical protein
VKNNRYAIMALGAVLVSSTMNAVFSPHLYANLLNHKHQFDPVVEIKINDYSVVNGTDRTSEAANAILIPAKEEVIEKVVNDIVPNKKLISLPAGYEITSNDLITRAAGVAFELNKARIENKNAGIQQNIKEVAKEQLYDFVRAQIVGGVRAKVIDPVLHRVVHALQIPHAVKHHKYFAAVSYIANRSVTYALIKGYDWTFDNALKLVKK